MKKPKSKVYQYIIDKSVSILINKKQTDELLDYIYNTYNIPRDEIMDIIAMRTEQDILNIRKDVNHIYYALVDGIYNAKVNKDVSPVEDFFDKEEIKLYSKPFPKKIKKFDLSFPCVTVDDDIWVGAVDVDWLMFLTNLGKIRYNPEIQRTMRKVKRKTKDNKEEIVYEISRNQKSIKGIRELFHNGQYIPNTIILNIPLDSKYEVYINDDREMVFNDSLEYLEILDGYHRYYGMCQEKIINPDFNCPIILQITRFGIEKGSRYIHQQDLKTKMRKVDSESMDTMAPANRICAILNDKQGHPWQGQIRRNGGYVNLPLLSAIIWQLYVKEIKDIKQKDIRSIADEIAKKTEKIIINNSDLEDRELEYFELCIIMCYCKYYIGEDVDIDNSTVNTVAEAIDELNDDKYKHLWKINGIHPLTPKTVKAIRGVIDKIT